jgi:protein-S-isoprenylcysteine O-methyltransferase Ste14
MNLHNSLADLIRICICVFAAAWILGAVWFGIKSPGGSRSWLGDWRQTLVSRAALVLGAGLVVKFTSGSGDAPGHRTGGFWRHLAWWQPELAVLGAVLAVAATALLLWARWTLGTMWTSVPTVQDHHELVVSGPYGIVRHPIYTGMLLLVFGGMLASGFGVWVLLLALALPWLLHRVRVEDRLMAGRFGARYAAYRARVPALLPFPRPGG